MAKAHVKDIQVEEEILSAVEVERPLVAPLPEGNPLLPKLADRVKRYWQTEASNMRKNQDSYKALLKAHRPSLDPNIRDVCSARHEVTSYLFGDNLAKSIKEAKELNNITYLMQKGESQQGRHS